jgi:hypothetical protein
MTLKIAHRAEIRALFDARFFKANMPHWRSEFRAYSSVKPCVRIAKDLEREPVMVELNNPVVQPGSMTIAPEGGHAFVTHGDSVVAVDLQSDTPIGNRATPRDDFRRYLRGEFLEVRRK